MLRIFAKKLLLAGMVAIFLALAADTIGAQPPKVTIAVIDGTGAPVPSIDVHLYEGIAGKCDCQNGACAIAPDVTVTTKKNGRAMVGLKPNTDYLACVDDRCGGQVPCTDATQCQFAGVKCQTFKTNAKGGLAQLVQIIR